MHRPPLDPVVWEKDADVAACRACAKAFSLVVRRHHCRGCGRIFCSGCAPYACVLPTELAENASGAQRVCAQCILRFASPAEPLSSGDASFYHCVDVTTQVRCLVVVAGYRLWVLVQGGTVRLSVPLLSVTSVVARGSTVTVNSSSVSYASNSSAQLVEHVVLECLDAGDLVASIRELLAAIRSSTLNTYRGYCDLYCTVPNASLLQEMVDLRARGSRCLDLSAIPGAQASQALALDVRPIAQALRYDGWFDALTFDGLDRRDAIAEMVKVVEANATLRALRMSNCDGAGVERLGHNMMSNAQCALLSLDLCGTPLSAAAVESLSQALAQKAAMEVLLLARCRLGDRELRLLCSRLPPRSLVHLDLGFNKFDRDSADALAQWLGKMSANGVESRLQKLHLRECSLPMATLFDPRHGAAMAALSRLREFDISGNPMATFDGAAALQFVTGFVATLTQMQRFAMADTKAHAELVVVPMISLLLTNDNVRCALELGGCDFSASSASAALQRSLGAALSSSLQKLDLSRINVKAPELCGIVNSLRRVDALDTLNISRALNTTAMTLADGTAVACALAELCTARASIRTLLVAGTSPLLVLPLLHVLASNASLMELDISSSRLADEGAAVVALFLRLNHTVRALALDDNGFELPSFLAIRAAIAAPDSTICFLQYPWADYERVRDKARVRACLQSLFDVVSLRRGGVGALADDARFAAYRPDNAPPVVYPYTASEARTEADEGVVAANLPQMVVEEGACDLPVPLHYPVEQPRDQPQQLHQHQHVQLEVAGAPADWLRAIRAHIKASTVKVNVLTDSVLFRNATSTVSAKDEHAAHIGNAMWLALNDQVMFLEDSDGEGAH